MVLLPSDMIELNVQILSIFYEIVFNNMIYRYFKLYTLSNIFIVSNISIE